MGFYSLKITCSMYWIIFDLRTMQTKLFNFIDSRIILKAALFKAPPHAKEKQFPNEISELR